MSLFKSTEAIIDSKSYPSNVKNGKNDVAINASVTIVIIIFPMIVCFLKNSIILF